MFRLFVFMLTLIGPVSTWAAGQTVELFKSPSCTCCDAYADYLRSNGFDVDVIAKRDLAAVKAQHGVPEHLSGCHTSLIGGYVFEGHIPVDSVQRVLEHRPDIAGISVPGMPVGSPGMGHGLEKPLRVWTIPADGGDTPEVHATYHRIPR